MELVPCPSCRRHIKDASVACPFCGAKPASAGLLNRIVTPRTVAGVVGVGLALSLCACYGPPPRDKAPPPPDPTGQNAPPPNTTPDNANFADPPPAEQPR